MKINTIKTFGFILLGVCLQVLTATTGFTQPCSEISNLQVTCDSLGTATVEFDLTNLTGLTVNIASFEQVLTTPGGENLEVLPSSFLFLPELPPGGIKRIGFQLENAPPGESLPIQYLLFHQDSAGIVSECCNSALQVTIPQQCGATIFIRGDVNGDNTLNVADAITSLNFLFTGGSIDCESSADSNDDGTNNIADPIQLLAYLFSSGPEPPAPFPACGADPTPDTLGCESYNGC